MEQKIDAEAPLYEGHEKHTVLSAVTNLLQFKNEHNVSDTVFSDMLALIKVFLPGDTKLPGSYSQVKQLVEQLNLGDETVDMCDGDEVETGVDGSCDKCPDLDPATKEILHDTIVKQLLDENWIDNVAQVVRNYTHNVVVQFTLDPGCAPDSRLLKELNCMISLEFYRYLHEDVQKLRASCASQVNSHSYRNFTIFLLNLVKS